MFSCVSWGNFSILLLKNEIVFCQEAKGEPGESVGHSCPMHLM